MEALLRAGVGNVVLATLLALVAAGAGRMLGRRPALRHALWVLVLLKLVTPPLSTVPLAWLTAPAVEEPGKRTFTVDDAGSAPIDELAAADVADRTETTAPDDESAGSSWWRLAAAAWLAGTCVVLVESGRRIRRWNRLLAMIRPAPLEDQDWLEELSRRMGLGRPPSLWRLPGTASPMLWALGGRARVIVPDELWKRLDVRQRTTLLIHELAHLRRRDHWVRLLEMLATAFYWWLPVVWIARRALHEAEEQCCDAWVVSFCPKDARTYAETLLQTVDFLSGSAPALPLAASGFGHVHHLKRRVIMIMRGTTPRSLNRAGFLAVFGLGALLLPLSPTWAQKGDEPKPADEKPADARPENDLKAVVVDEVLDSADEKILVVEKVLADEQVAGLRKVLEAKQLLNKKLLDKQQKLEDKKAKDSADEPSKQGKDGDADAGDSRNAFREKLRDYERERLDMAKDRSQDAAKLKEKFKAIAKEGKDAKESIATTAPELAKARAEVERARAELRAAERRLAALRVPRSAPPSKPSMTTTSRNGKLFKSADAPRGGDAKRPAGDRRIDEIESALQKLLDEVKSLKGEREKSK